MLAAASVATPLTLVGVLLSVFGLVGLAAAVRVYFKAASGEQLINQQNAAITALQATVAEQDRQLGILRESNTHMSSELATLREMVTQAAKVDDLTVLVRNGFVALGVKVEKS